MSKEFAQRLLRHLYEKIGGREGGMVWREEKE